MTSHWMQMPTGNDQYNIVYLNKQIYVDGLKSVQAAKTTCTPRDTAVLAHLIAHDEIINSLASRE